MTQAYNLAILANAVDTSGRLNVGTNATGTLPVANGGTGTSTPSLVAGSGISISGSFPNQTVSATGGASGTVTSVATGNGLQGGTITTSGTLSVACPSIGSVGSYAFLANFLGSTVGPGGTISGASAPYACAVFSQGGEGTAGAFPSGSWRSMGFFVPGTTCVCCRIS